MVPATSEDNIEGQLSLLHKKLQAYCEAENSVLEAAFLSLPRTSVFNVPQLFSGQPDISNLGLDHFPVIFQEFPGNAGPIGTAMQMPFQQALETIFAVNNVLTLKTIMSFSEYRDYAMKYSNGLLLVLNPTPGAVTWENASYITPLSDDPEKNEYNLLPGSKFLIQNIRQQQIDNKEIWVFTLMLKICT